MKKRIIAVCLILVSAVSLSGCGGGKGGMPPMGEEGGNQQVAITVNTSTISPLTIEQYVTVSSKVLSDNEVSVMPKVSGTVKKVNVSLGDTVKAGDVLFEIDDSDLKLQVQQAQAGLQSAQAGLQSSQAGLKSAQANYDMNVGGNYQTQLDQLQSNVNTYQIQYNDLLTSLEQKKELYAIGGASKQDVDDLQSSVEKAKLQLDTAKNELETKKTQILEETKKTSQASVDQAQASVSQSQASIAQSQVSLESAQKSLNDTKVVAEIGGVIGSMNISEGSTVNTGSAAMTIVSMDKIKVAFNVSEDAINRVSVGSKAYVTISSVSDDPIEVSVSNVSPSADSQTKLYTVEAYIDNPTGEIKPGMFASVKLVLDKKDNTISVPLNTVIEKNGEKYVYVVDSENIAHKKNVETGLKNDEYIEITSGVDMGDVVVTKGQDFLSDGSLVNIVDPNVKTDTTSTDSKTEEQSGKDAADTKTEDANKSKADSNKKNDKTDKNDKSNKNDKTEKDGKQDEKTKS